jgi:hypothetical protein
MMVSSLLLLPALDGYIHGDVHLYQAIDKDLLDGTLPYRDRVVEYPPYAIPIFLAPRAFGEEGYPGSFMVMALAVDWLIKLVLIRQSFRHSEGFRSLLPGLGYSAAVPFLGFFLLQRFDLWPALITLLALGCACSGRQGCCGLWTAVGVGVKLYPLVLAPPLFILAAREGKGRRFLAGLAGGLLPIALLSFVLPWWRFAEFHGARGLQCESLYAAVLWFGHQLGLIDAQWLFTKAWVEVQGAMASAVLPWARGVFALTVIFSAGLSACAAASLEKPSLSQVSRLLLLPLMAFVAFNQVLSPQYLVWILPLAALSALEGSSRVMLLTGAATMVTPIIYPSLFGDYGTGLNVFETAVLLGRDLVLVGIWALLVKESLRLVRVKGWIAPREVWRMVWTAGRRSA